MREEGGERDGKQLQEGGVGEGGKTEEVISGVTGADRCNGIEVSFSFLCRVERQSIT